MILNCAINMKCLLVVFLVGTALAVPTVVRHRRDILPGDPRYGTDYHHHHHHAHENNHHEEHYHPSTPVQVVKATGQYTGSYVAPSQGYGPPGYQPGTPINTQNTAVVETYQPTTHVHHPAPTYGAPVHHHHEVFKPVVPTTTKVITSQPIDSYGTPVNTHVHHHHQQQQVQPAVQQPTRKYLSPVIENKTAGTYTQVAYEPNKVNNGYLAPTVHQHTLATPTNTYVPAVQRSQVTVETVPATLQQTYTETVRDEPAVSTSGTSGTSGTAGSFPNFPSNFPTFPNFEVPQFPDFSQGGQVLSDAVSNFGENYENFISNFNPNNQFTFPGFGTQTETQTDEKTRVVVEKQPIEYKQVQIPTTIETATVTDHHHHHHHHQQQQPTVQQEAKQVVDSNGGYVY